MDIIVAKRYASALFDVAKETNRIQEILGQLRETSSIITGSKELNELFLNPSININDKKNIVKEILSSFACSEIIELSMLLIEKDRINEINYVYIHFKKMVYEYMNIKVARATTAVDMTDEEKVLLEERLSKKYSCRIIVENVVDPSIIGGVYLKVEDEVTDGSIRGRLERMKKELLSNDKEVKA
jgi:F-type H+-transporting ATPase subunit delta